MRGAGRTGTLMDRQTLAELIRVHQAELYRYMRYLGAKEDVAEDLVQETFLAAMRSNHAPVDEPPNVAAAWLRGTGRNLFLTYCRRQRRNPVKLSSDFLREADNRWASVFLRDGDGFDYVEALRRCVAGLNGRKRSAIDMRYKDGKSRVEMASALGITENSVRSLLQRVRAALANCVERRLKTEGA